MAEFYFADRRMEIQAVGSTDETDAILILEDDLQETLKTASGIYTITISTLSEKYDPADIQEHTKILNYILVKRPDSDKCDYYTIMDVEEDYENYTRSLTVENAGLDLLNEVLPPWGLPADQQNIVWYLEKAISDSGFVIGINEYGKSNRRKLKWDGSSTALERAQSIATQFDNCELSFSFEVKGLQVTKKYLDIYKHRGSQERKQLFFGREIKNIKKTESAYDLATALQATGGTPEGKETPINLYSYVGSSDNGRYYTEKNSYYVKDREALKIYSRYIAPNETGNDVGHIVAQYSYETTSQSELFNRTVAELKKRNHPTEGWEIELYYMPDGLSVGDEVAILHPERDLYLEARVEEITYSITGLPTVKFGDFLQVDSGIDEDLRKMADAIANIEKTQIYYRIVFVSTNGFNFMNGEGYSDVTALVFKGNEDVTEAFEPERFVWQKYDDQGVHDTEWEAQHNGTGNTIRIYGNDPANYDVNITKEE